MAGIIRAGQHGGAQAGFKRGQRSATMARMKGGGMAGRDWLWWLLCSLVAGLMLGIAALAITLLQPPRGAGTSAVGAGDARMTEGLLLIDPPIPLPAFSLRNSGGEPAGNMDWRGQFVLLSFGFTQCPDICPMTLQGFARVRGQLGADAQQLQMVFISVDGTRDTPQVLRRYFHIRGWQDIVALTGAEAHVRQIGAPLGLAFERSAAAGDGAYTVNHSAGAYLLDPEGRWIRRYRFGLPAEEIARDIRGLLGS